MRRSYTAALSLVVLSALWFADTVPAGESVRQERDKQIALLISQLGDPEYAVRERAQRELIQLSFAAFDALSEAEDSDDIEIASQARYLVRLIRVEWTKDSDPSTVRGILRDYDALSIPNRQERIKQLAALPGDTGIQWLARLVRFEQSQLLSKRAALAIMAQEPKGDDAAWTSRADTILEALDRSKRPASDWLRTYVIERREPEQAVQQWADHIKAERRTLQERPQQSHHTLVLDLMRRQVELFDRLNRPDESLAMMRKMVAAERGDSESLGELVAWFAKRKGWSAIDELATRFARTFDSDALLLYALAEARLAQGKPDDAEQAVTHALAINGDKGPDHIAIARQLQERGLMHWAEREYKHVIATSSESVSGLFARLRLSEVYHDRLDEKPAAEMMEETLKIMGKDKNLSARIQQLREVRELEARKHYYWAKHYESQKDEVQMIERLEKAIEADKSDADVLIAMYRLPTATSEYRDKTKERIKAAADGFRKEIEADPDDPTPYNQLAWLIGNTEGDVDEAIRLSQRSVDLARASDDASVRHSVGGYLDTLAHCYFAKKDFENAVRSQAEANRLEPESMAIKRQLEVFRQALADQKRAN